MKMIAILFCCFLFGCGSSEYTANAEPIGKKSAYNFVDGILITIHSDKAYSVKFKIIGGVYPTNISGREVFISSNTQLAVASNNDYPVQVAAIDWQGINNKFIFIPATINGEFTVSILDTDDPDLTLSYEIK